MDKSGVRGPNSWLVFRAAGYLSQQQIWAEWAETRQEVRASPGAQNEGRWVQAVEDYLDVFVAPPPPSSGSAYYSYCFPPGASSLGLPATAFDGAGKDMDKYMTETKES